MKTEQEIKKRIDFIRAQQYVNPEQVSYAGGRIAALQWVLEK